MTKSKTPAPKPAPKAAPKAAPKTDTGERRSPDPAPVFVKLTADGIEYGPRGKVLRLPGDQAAEAIEKGEAVLATAKDRGIAGV